MSITSRPSRELLRDRLRLVGEAGALEAERLRLLQIAAGAEIAMASGATDSDHADRTHDLERVNAALRSIGLEIAAIDREIAGE